MRYFNLGNRSVTDHLINDTLVECGIYRHPPSGIERIAQDRLLQTVNLPSGHDDSDQNAGSCGERSRTA